MLKPKASQKSGWRKDRRAKCLFCIGWVFRGESFSSSSFPFASLSFLLVSSVTVYASLRNIGASKQQHWLIKLKVGLKVQMGKEKMKVIRLWKPHHCKKHWKRRTNQTGLKKSSCPPASPQLSRSSSSSCVLSSSSECRSSCVLTHILFSFFFLPFTFLILLFIFSATVSDCLRKDANKQKQWLKKWTMGLQMWTVERKMRTECD